MCFIMTDTGRSVFMSHKPGDNGLLLIPPSPRQKRVSGGAKRRCDVSTLHSFCWVSVLAGFKIMSNLKDESTKLNIF